MFVSFLEILNVKCNWIHKYSSSVTERQNKKKKIKVLKENYEKHRIISF